MTFNPWDIPPLPKKGDASKSIIYEAVGLALSNWEFFEFALGQIFITLLQADRITAMRAYGSVLTYRARADMIEASAEAYFAVLRAPRVKADFRSLMNRSGKFAARRNEIAHGHVQEFKAKNSRKDGWALYPAFYNTNKKLLLGTRIRKTSVVTIRRPIFELRYVYTSAEINEFAAQFWDLSQEAFRLQTRINDLRLHPLVRLALKHPEKLSPQQLARFEMRPPRPSSRQRVFRE